MITEHKTGPINHKINNNFSMPQNTSFSTLATLISPMLTIKMKRVIVKCTSMDISQQKPTQRQQDTILDTGEKPLIELKNSFNVSSCSTIFF
jgi:hypothetical protein